MTHAGFWVDGEFRLPGSSHTDKDVTKQQAWLDTIGCDSSQETEVATEVSPPSESILDEAKRLVCGDRQASYGPPDQDFRRTADMINGLFRDYFKEGCEFKPKDIAAIMILIKLSRNRHQNKRDNPVDIAGYAHCMNVCMECEKTT
jgi:hypothetical protein